MYKKVFEVQATEYFKSIYKKDYEEGEASENIFWRNSKIKRKQKKKHSKMLHKELQTYWEKVKDLVAVGKAIACTDDIF